MRPRRLAGVLLSVLALAGCHASGTWSDDPKNYQRAWGHAPSDLQVRHSWYWRSPHFSREEAYYFQFAKNAERMHGFIVANGLLPADAAMVTVSDYSCFSRPTWFAPKPITAYNAWVAPPSAGTGRGLILEDRATGDFFVSACQL